MPVFNLKPTISTFLQEAYTFGILENPVVPASLLNFHIQLAFPLGMEQNYRLHFDFYPALSMKGYGAVGALKMISYSTKLPSNSKESGLPERALKILKSAGYVLLYVDYFYVKGTSQYGKRHFRHDFLLFDYNSNSREFKGALYTSNKTFGLGTIPFDRLGEAVTSPFARGKESYGYCQGNLFAVFKAGSRRRRAGMLDLSDIRTQVACYLDSSDLACHQLNNRLITQLCQLHRRTHTNVIFGIGVYDQIWSFVERAFVRGNVWQVLRFTRLLWEHKKLMKVRLLRIIEEGVMFDTTFLAQWDEIVQTAYLIHLRVMMAGERNDPRLLCSLPKNFARLKLMEQRCMSNIVKRIG